MAKSKKKVETVFLVCEETGDYNYTLGYRVTSADTMLADLVELTHARTRSPLSRHSAQR